MNAHQRRKQRRLYERAFGNHVDYFVSIKLNSEDDDMNVGENGRYLLYRKNDAGIHEPAGRFDTAQSAKEHAEQDAIMRGLTDRPYQWGASYFGAWTSLCPDFNIRKMSLDFCNDYVVIDSEWREIDPTTTIAFPPPDPSREE